MIFLTDGKRHLICDPFSVSNLHLMADTLGLNRCWFHSGKFPHYDIPKRRQDEIEALCVQISSKDLLMRIKNEIE